MTFLITHIIHQPKSGIGTVVRQLIENNVSDNFSYQVILLETDRESERQFLQLGAVVVGLSISSNPFSTLRTITKSLQTTDIVHIHSFLPQLVSFLTATRKSKKIRTIHNNYPYFFATDIRSRLKRFTEGLLVRFSNSDLISVSDDTLRSLPWRLSKKNISISIENGIGTRQTEAHTQTETYIERPQGFLIAVVGRLERQKGFDVLIDALALLQTKLAANRTPIHLWIIGEGSCRKNLEQQAKALNLQNVKFIGYQSEPEKYLAKADLFVLPSRFEGFGLAAAEAMFLGLPVILTNFGGLASRLQHGQEAHIVPLENPNELANALLMLFNEAEYRELLAINGKLFIEKHFSIKVCTANYADAYLRKLKEI